MLTTAFVVAITIAFVLTYDLIVYVRSGTDSTITGLVRWCNAKWPLFGVLLGMIIGGLLVHWFGLYRNNNMANTKTSALNALAGASIDAADYVPWLDSSASELKKVLASAFALADSAKTASFTAAPGYFYRVDMNGAGADFTVTFPASPSVGDRFGYVLSRAHGTYRLLANRNSQVIEGATSVAEYALLIQSEVMIWRFDDITSGAGWVLERDGRKFYLPGSVRPGIGDLGT